MNSLPSKGIKRAINTQLILTIVHDCDGHAFSRVAQLPGFSHIKIQPGGPVRLACVYLITDDSDMHDSWHPGGKFHQQTRSVCVFLTAKSALTSDCDESQLFLRAWGGPVLGHCRDLATLLLHSRHYKGHVCMHVRVWDGERIQLVGGKEVKMRSKGQRYATFL